MPKDWSWLTGHLLCLKKYTDRLPADAHVLLPTHNLAVEFADTEMLLMDTWPVFPALVMAYDPDAALQISTSTICPSLLFSPV
jgi:hypothetical protein